MTGHAAYPGAPAAGSHEGDAFDARFMALNERIRARANELMKYAEIVAAAQSTEDVIRILRATDKLVRQRDIVMKGPMEELDGEARTRIRHDMRNHLNLIIGYAEILEEDVEAKAATTVVAAIRDILAAANELLELVNAALAPHEGGPAAPLSRSGPEGGAGER